MSKIIAACIIIALLAVILAIILLRAGRLKKKKAAVSPQQPLRELSPFTKTDISELPIEKDLEDRMWYEEETAFLFKLNEKISLALGKNTIAQGIVEEVQRFMNTNACILFLLEEHTGDLRVEAAVGAEAEKLRNFFLSKGESITGTVLTNKEAILINDLSKNWFYKSINQESYITNAFISVPLVVKGIAIGALNVSDKRSQEQFSKRDLDLLVNVARVAAIAFQNADLHEQIQEDYLKTITTLALILDARDPYTKRHSENVTRYSVAIAKKMGFNFAWVEMIRRAGLLHDIGKIGIRDDVLLKPAKLTPEEFELIKAHPVKGQAIVMSLPFLRDVSFLVRHHHERYDGKGYPDGEAGEEIELGARILAVSDSFDAMTTDRPYRQRLSLKESTEELKRCKGTQFDPIIVDHFLAVLAKEPGILELERNDQDMKNSKMS